ncbi:hypothetical protein ACVXG8_00885 [Escherichia coli]
MNLLVRCAGNLALALTWTCRP